MTRDYGVLEFKRPQGERHVALNLNHSHKRALIQYVQAAAADSKSSQAAQTEWLLQNMQPHFLRKLLHIVGQIEKQVLPTSGDASHAFPRLAGSHLSEVSPPRLIPSYNLATTR